MEVPSPINYLRTCPSVYKTIKEKAVHSSPKEVISSIDKEIGGPLELTNPSEAVRNREQVYNINRNLKRKKSRKTGPPNLADYKQLYVMLIDGSFVKNIEFVNSGDGTLKPLIFATTNDHVEMIKRYASAHNPSLVLGVDMTFKCGPFYVTLFVLPHPPVSYTHLTLPTKRIV